MGLETAAEFLALSLGRAYSKGAMRTIFGMLGTTLAGALGWAVGQRVGIGTAVILSAIGSGFGLYWGRKLFDEWLG